MSGENLTPRAEQNSDNTESLDNNAEQPSFDSRVEPISSNNRVDNRSIEDSRGQNLNDAFDSRVEPVESTPTIVDDAPPMDFDDRVMEIDNVDTSGTNVPEQFDDQFDSRMEDDLNGGNETVNVADDLITGQEEVLETGSNDEFGEIVGQVNNTDVNNKPYSLSVHDKTDHETDNTETKSSLSEAEREQIKAETGWSDKIIDHIENMDQYEIYKKANLKEVVINDRPCLVKADFDPDYVSPKTIDDEHPNGVSNRELMADGKSPYDSKTGEKLELHHMGQDYDSPFAELCENGEHGDGNHETLHDNTKPSWRRDPELKNKYNNEDKPNHWKERINTV